MFTKNIEVEDEPNLPSSEDIIQILRKYFNPKKNHDVAEILLRLLLNLKRELCPTELAKKVKMKKVS